jgi:hypothetical protein
MRLLQQDKAREAAATSGVIGAGVVASYQPAGDDYELTGCF